MNLLALPKLPSMPILEETAEEIYQRFVNRAIELAKKNGTPPPPTGEGEDFHYMWFPLAQEWAEQQELLTYAFIQGFPVWADGEFLQAHAWAEGVEPKDGEDDELLRLRILDHAFLEEGTGRRKDYEAWAKEIPGVGGAIAVEKERHDNSIDLYLTDMNGQPVTPEFAEQVKEAMWEEKRIAGHDLQAHPAPVFTLRVEATLNTTSDPASLADLIKNRIVEYAKGRSTLVYNYIAALLLVDTVENYSNFTLNGDTEDIIVPDKSILRIEMVLS
ncbi:baseplate J/gp47 family protein [Aneurinibacillus thermoaerophilus]|uniref:Baseplate J-like protein n=1 Tax=Aneurinibacillus thermoaerophilus TaxID=143495 RepID=A0A1G8ET07_ANETH|nr:baseplate J/gp47 family protein [Aneurinibacillus thermoaerophilus]MED0757420.1 baseplate J/gp47 family protein [Aneurinibacillus thermoaerophilus]MED0762610.1 baseplate J/gp47 family protein [Aneurinibacillus thermoaerophilus]SDH72869.1 Baseplate J-like protein [Aneurinibacillus thermoaerophilus]